MLLQKIEYGPGPTTLAFSLPARNWVPLRVGIGAGREESAAGVVSTWATRTDRLLSITQRFMESEWPNVELWLDYALENGNTFKWFPDITSGTFYTCILVSPTITDEIEPTRLEYLGAMEINFRIRRADGLAIPVSFF